MPAGSHAMTLSAGARLGPYEIVDLIGLGGMGEVHRARDTRLSRDVAVKILPASMCEDKDRLRRFEQPPADALAAERLRDPEHLDVRVPAPGEAVDPRDERPVRIAQHTREIAGVAEAGRLDVEGIEPALELRPVVCGDDVGDADRDAVAHVR